MLTNTVRFATILSAYQELNKLISFQRFVITNHTLPYQFFNFLRITSNDRFFLQYIGGYLNLLITGS